MVRFLKLNFTMSLKSHFNPLLLRQIEGGTEETLKAILLLEKHLVGTVQA